MNSGDQERLPGRRGCSHRFGDGDARQQLPVGPIEGDQGVSIVGGYVGSCSVVDIERLEESFTAFCLVRPDRNQATVLRGEAGDSVSIDVQELPRVQERWRYGLRK